MAPQSKFAICLVKASAAEGGNTIRVHSKLDPNKIEKSGPAGGLQTGFAGKFADWAAGGSMKVAACLMFALLVASSTRVTASNVDSDVQPTTNVESRQQYFGFSVRPPASPGWFVTISEQSPRRATYRHALPTTTHTFVASVVIGQLDKSVPIDDALVPHGIANSDRMQVVENSHRTDESRKTKCIRYAIHIKDNHPPNAPDDVLDLIDLGLVCVHPTIPDSYVRASYSERGLESELDSKLWADLEEFLRGVQIESAPGVPAA
jgi:hypothetical protein